MTSLVLRTTAAYLLPLLTLFSLFLLVRGHHAPGGGFAGGLIAGSAFALYALAYGADRCRAVLRVRPKSLIAAGLLVALMSGLFGVAAEGAFLAGVHPEIELPETEISSVLLFDAGVYLLVTGAIVLLILTIQEAV